MNYPRFSNIEAAILYFNGMYKLPVAPYPSVRQEVAWMLKTNSSSADASEVQKGAVRQRMQNFYGKILQKELAEHKDILENLTLPEYGELDFLTDQAELLGDIIIYCMYEMVRLGLPVLQILHIIMESNFSKLDESGEPIYSPEGKLEKGPNYWKPEPKIKALLTELVADVARCRPSHKKQGE